MVRHLLLATAAALLVACRGPQPLPTSDDAPEAVARRFLAAVEAGAWEEAHALLSERWRRRLGPERLAADWRLGGALAADRLSRARAALRQPPAEAEGGVEYDGAIRLVREAGGYRVDGLGASGSE